MISAETQTRSIEDLLHEAEPLLVRIACKHCKVIGMEADDFAQELRIQALRLARRFDPSNGVPWFKYAAMYLRRRATDVIRDYGNVSRGGYVRFSAVPLSQVRDDDRDEGRSLPIEPVDSFATDGIEAVEWHDLVSRLQAEPLGVRAFVDSCNGLPQSEIARRNGLSESRISQLLNVEGEQIKARIQSVLTQPPIRNPAMNQPVPADPVERMLNVFENATPETLEKVDARIATKQGELETLKRMRVALAKTLGVKPQSKPAQNGQTLGDRIYDSIAKGTSVRVESLVTTLGVSNQSIRVSARRSKRLDIKGDMVSRRS